MGSKRGGELNRRLRANSRLPQGQCCCPCCPYSCCVPPRALSPLLCCAASLPAANSSGHVAFMGAGLGLDIDIVLSTMNVDYGDVAVAAGLFPVHSSGHSRTIWRPPGKCACHARARLFVPPHGNPSSQTASPMFLEARHKHKHAQSACTSTLLIGCCVRFSA